MSKFWMNMLLAVTLVGSDTVAQSVRTTPTQAPSEAPQGGQRPGGPPVGRPANIAGAKNLPAPSGVQPLYQGTVDGYVFWDTSAVQHNPPAACEGLAVQVSAGSPPTGSALTFERFTPLGTFNKFTYLNNGSKLGVCAYAVKVPVGQDLQVQVMVTPSAFSQGVAAVTPPTANNANGPIKIISGKCNNLPPAVPSPTVLGSRWWTCGNFAYNVNFVLQSSASSSPLIAPGKQGLLPGSAGGSVSPAPGGMLTTTTVPAVQSPGSAVEGQGNNGRISQSTQKALTNGDILKMVHGGVPESVIISSIQAGTKRFDFGPNGCRALHQAHVSEIVLRAMGEGFTVPCSARTVADNTNVSADNVKPQPVPPGQKPIDPALLKKVGPAKARPVVKNAAGASAAIIAVLQKQRSTADAEAVQMKLGIRPGAPAGPSGGQSELMSATRAQSPGIGQAVSPAALNTVTAANAQTSKISPAMTRFALESTVAMCASDSSFRILNVSGSGSPATFTPIDQYNLYTITGCSFGNPGNADKVYLYGVGGFRGNFSINFWSDNSIVITLDPTITGHPDLANLSLVVQRADGQQAQKQGFSFYAARQRVSLNAIPSSWVTLANFPSGFAVGYSSPLTSADPPSNATAYVSRNANGEKFNPNGQSDYYDFSQLAPGWTTDSFQVTTYPEGCPYMITYKEDFGTWSWNWDSVNPNNIRVGLSDTTCSGVLPPTPWVNYRNWTGSDYALHVWVIGPRGVDPLTNQPAM